VFDRRSAVRRAAALGLIVGAASITAALRSGADPTAPAGTPVAPAPLPDSIAFDVDFAGVGAEGVDLVWRGTVGAQAPGIATIRLEYAGAPRDRAQPVWPVNAWLFFSADDLRRSFAAELSGSMNWKTGEMRVTGLVSDGVRRDAAVEQRVRLQDRGLTGRVTVRFTDAPTGVALRHPAAGSIARLGAVRTEPSLTGRAEHRRGQLN
jgi:hypothetical protein